MAFGVERSAYHLLGGPQDEGADVSHDLLTGTLAFLLDVVACIHQEPVVLLLPTLTSLFPKLLGSCVRLVDDRPRLLPGSFQLLATPDG